MRCYLFALALVGAAAVASEVQAQFVVSGPSGSIGIRNPNGTYTFIYPGRLNPAANIARPGTFQTTPWGNVWAGVDGQVHGNLVDQTGNIHLKEPAGRYPNSGYYRSPQNSRGTSRYRNRTLRYQ